MSGDASLEESTIVDANPERAEVRQASWMHRRRCGLQLSS
jgi:hypothetical protein